MPRKSGPLSGSRPSRRLFDFQFGGSQFCLGRETKLMAVLNVTPDSFSDGGLFRDPARALEQALRLEREGAHLLDVGGESTRPGAQAVSTSEEIRRIRPVLKLLAKKIKIPISVDTYKAEVAHAALDEGATLVNDITGLGEKSRMARLVARYRAGIVLMHMRGTPQTMQNRTDYQNLLKEILDSLKKSVQQALAAGISQSGIVIDPGFGFAKTTEQNLEILRHLAVFSKLKLPILVGLSRKSFIGNLLGTPVSDRLYGSLGAAAAAIAGGAHILRVHDVLAHRQLAQIMDSSCPSFN